MRMCTELYLRSPHMFKDTFQYVNCLIVSEPLPLLLPAPHPDSFLEVTQGMVVAATKRTNKNFSLRFSPKEIIWRKDALLFSVKKKKKKERKKRNPYN